MFIKAMITGFAFLMMAVFASTAQAQGTITVNSGNYADLQAAVGAADGVAYFAGDVVELGADILTGTSQLTIGRNLTLDLNGYSLTIELPDANPGGRNANGIKIASGITFTIMDSNSGANELNVTNRASILVTPGNGAAINSSDGTLIIQSGTVRATGGHCGAGIGGGNGGAGAISASAAER